LGSRGVGRALGRSAMVAAALFGHLHRRIDARVGSIRAVSSPVGYLRRWRGDVRALAAERVALIEI